MSPPPNQTDDEPEPTEDELRAAAELARALDGGGDPSPGSDAAFAKALRATTKREPKLADEKRSAVVDRAFARGSGAARARTFRRSLALAAAALIAIAIPAGIALTGSEPEPVVVGPVTFGGPTDAVFGAPFADDQRASERMDRIATTRAHDYFAAIAAAGQR
jgi:hypothetical protein